jgi:hypothetical protein
VFTARYALRIYNSREFRLVFVLKTQSFSPSASDFPCQFQIHLNLSPAITKTSAYGGHQNDRNSTLVGLCAFTNERTAQSVSDGKVDGAPQGCSAFRQHSEDAEHFLRPSLHAGSPFPCTKPVNLHHAVKGTGLAKKVKLPRAV